MELADRPETAECRDQYIARYADSEFISKFVIHISSPEFQKWVPILKAVGLNSHRLHGFRVFDQLGDFLKEQVSDYAAEEEALRPIQMSPPRPKPAKKKTVQVAQSPLSSPPRGQTPQRGGTVSPRAYAVKTPMRGWHDQSRSRPCPIDNHGSHELGTCADFISMNPKDRRLVSQYKVCYTCLSPLWSCREMLKSTLCVYERVFQSLICKQCAESVKGRKLSGMNLLMCSHKEHSKPTPDEMAPIL